MNVVNYLSITILFAGLMLTGCKQSLVISDVNYAQPVETVIEPDKEGIVNDPKNGFSFNILPLQYAETEDTSSVTTSEVRFIRSKNGFYYITAPEYRNVYVMAPEESELKLKNRIRVSEEGVAKPALNQRGEYIQLVDRATGTAWALNNEGVQEGESIASNKRGEK